MLNMAHFKDDSSPNGTLASLFDIDLVIIIATTLIYFLVISLLLSMGLLSMGPHLCLVFGGKIGMFSCIEV